MLKFCFPERDPEGIEEPQVSQRDSSFYVPIERREDVEKMKERADKNKLFIYIKIPEVPVRVSYKVSYSHVRFIYEKKYRSKIFHVIFLTLGKQRKKFRRRARYCSRNTNIGVSQRYVDMARPSISYEK